MWPDRVSMALAPLTVEKRSQDIVKLPALGRPIEYDLL